MTDKRYIECGKIINTHGCRGGVKAESWCNSEEDLAELSRVFILRGSEYEEYKVTKSSIFKQFDFEFITLSVKNSRCLRSSFTLFS